MHPKKPLRQAVITRERVRKKKSKSDKKWQKDSLRTIRTLGPEMKSQSVVFQLKVIIGENIESDDHLAYHVLNPPTSKLLAWAPHTAWIPPAALHPGLNWHPIFHSEGLLKFAVVLFYFCGYGKLADSQLLTTSFLPPSRSLIRKEKNGFFTRDFPCPIWPTNCTVYTD